MDISLKGVQPAGTVRVCELTKRVFYILLFSERGKMENIYRGSKNNNPLSHLPQSEHPSWGFP